MNLFNHSRSPANPDQIRQIKAWVYDALNLLTDIPIAISQLQPHEPGCPPVETVIAVMSQPTQTFKIHTAAEQITASDVQQAICKN